MFESPNIFVVLRGIDPLFSASEAAVLPLYYKTIFVTSIGFEPITRLSKSRMLPLHYEAVHG